MSENPRTRLTPIAEEALEILTESIHEHGDEGCPRSEAHQLLIDHEAFDQGRAEQAVHQLLMRGYLYEVEGQLFVTPE